ncbi:MAG: hypothetical protein Q9224_007281, partial [Gallowayella concinna]
MPCINLLIPFLLIFASDILANAPAPSNIGNAAAVSLGITQLQDIGIDQLWRGRPLDEESITIYTLHFSQLELYRRTVQNRGDAALPPLDIRTAEAYLRLEIRPFETQGTHMTLGSSFYGAYIIMRTMLLPETPAGGYWELKWRISNSAMIPGKEVPIGYLNLLLENPANAQTSVNVSSDSTVLAPPLRGPQSDPANDLSAPTPVPATNIILLPGPLGAALNLAEVILTLNSLISSAWQSVAVNQRPEPVREQTWHSLLRERVSVTMRPRMDGNVPLVTDTELAEAAFGIVYYILVQERASATTFTIVKPNRLGKRTPIAEIEIRGGGPSRIR